MTSLTSKEFCTGCGACAQICKHNAIKMLLDHKGFSYPEIEKEVCIDCGLCEKACHVVSRQKEERKTSVRQTLVMRNQNEEVLFKSSSGGVFYSVARYILEDCQGVVVGAVYNTSMEVEHYICRSMNELPRLMQSKYVDSRLDNIYNDIRLILKQGTKVLFTGTPCQVNGLKHFLQKTYPNLLTIDLLCYGGVSPVVFRDYILYLESMGIKDIESFNMRNKRYTGWEPATSWNIRLKNGKSIYNDRSLPQWMTFFMSGFIHKPACGNCLYTNIDRCGDISIGDYWDKRHLHDELYSRKGTSIVFVNSQLGVETIKKLENDFWMTAIPTEDAMQPCLISPFPLNEKMDEFWTCYANNGFNASYEYFIKPIYPTKSGKRLKDKLKEKAIQISTSAPWNFEKDFYNSKSYLLLKTIKSLLKRK